MAEKIIVIDEGTTSTRTMLFDSDGTPLGSAQREFRQHYPGPGLVEHDAAEIWDATLACTRDMVAPAENSAMSRPEGSAVSLFSTSISWPRNVSFLPSDRAEAKNRTELAGKSRSSRSLRMTWPT